MARQARLAVAGLAHYVLLRGHAARQVFVDDVDRLAFVNALWQTAKALKLVVHAAALLDAQVHLLLRPAHAPDLGRLVQALGRTYVAAFNRRHGSAGTLWDGRYRAAAIEPGEPTLAALIAVDGLNLAAPWVAPTPRLNDVVQASGITDPQELWQLGNTPFEREAAYRQRLQQAQEQGASKALIAAVQSNRAHGSDAFLKALALQLGRPVSPAPRGRPRRMR
jgi:putative transposase